MSENSALIHRLQTLAKKTPKRSNLIICTGRDEGMFVDSAKHFFLHLLRHEPDIEAHFLTLSETEHAKITANGLPSLLFSGDVLPLLAQAKVVVADDSSLRLGPAWPILEQAYFLQIWHGIPLKKIGFPEIMSTHGNSPEDIRDLELVYSSGDAVVSTSPFMTEHAFSPAFRSDTFIETGYPRNDALHREPDELDLINVDMPIYEALKQHLDRGGKTVFFMPTFRDSGGNPLGALELEPLSRFAVKHDILFLAKLHPCLQAPSGQLAPNVLLCDSQSDPYPLLTRTDLLVTDYSSIYFDFLLTDRPMVFFAPDLQSYLTNDREMFFDYNEFTPGPKATDTPSLLAAMLRELETDGTDWAQARQTMAKRCFTHLDGNSSQRIMQFLRENVL